MEYRQKKGLSLKWLNPLLLLGGRHRDRTCDFFRVNGIYPQKRLNARNDKVKR